MAAEGIIAVVAGIVAGSIALIGFGIDSAIEGFASVVIVWRFTGSRILSEEAEPSGSSRFGPSSRATTRMRAWWESSSRRAASSSCPLLGRAKQRIGLRIGSSATASEGKQNLLCAYLAAALLIGLLGNALFGAWWLDPIVGLLIAGLAIQEGRDAWRGDACCH